MVGPDGGSRKDTSSLHRSSRRDTSGASRLRRASVLLVSVAVLGLAGLSATFIVNPSLLRSVPDRVASLFATDAPGEGTAAAGSAGTQSLLQALPVSIEKMSSSISEIVLWAAAENLMNTLVDRFPGVTASVGLIDLNTGRVVNSGVQQAFVAASTTKVLTAACYLNQVERGTASLDRSIDGCTARLLIEQMINRSDNDSWRSLKSWMGYDDVEAYAHQIGLSSFDVYGNTITAADDALMLQKLYLGQLLNQEDTAWLLSCMQNTNNEELIPAALPDGVTVYHKYGNLDETLNDTAIIKCGNRAMVLAIYTDGESSSSDQQETLIHEVTRSALILLSSVDPTSRSTS